MHTMIPSATNTEQDQTFSTDQRQCVSMTSSSPYGRRRTDAPATYVHEYELVIARWQARRYTQKPCQLPCSVCLEIMDPAVWTRPTPLCRHEPRICGSCLVQFIDHAIREEGLTEVFCPDSGCRHRMNNEDVANYIRGDIELLNRFNQLVDQRSLETHSNFVYCTNPTCARGQLHVRGAASPLVTCQYCNTNFCFTHRIPWHTHLTCEEYNTAERHASEEYIEKHTKRCPNPTCRRPIEKASGCDHMTCRRPGGCGHEFCWDCLADYGPIRKEGNHLHNPSCRHYAGSSSTHPLTTMDHEPFIPPAPRRPLFPPTTPMVRGRRVQPSTIGPPTPHLPPPIVADPQTPRMFNPYELNSD